MTYTDDDMEAIAEFIEAGAHLVPFTKSSGRKTPPKGFNYITDGRRIETPCEAGTFLGSGFELMGVLPVSINMIAVDFDVPDPLTDEEMRDNGFKLISEYKTWKKQEWHRIATPAEVQRRMDRFLTTASSASANLPPYAAMLSSSGKGFHFYYKFKGRKPTAPLIKNRCMELRCANNEIMIPAEWHKLRGFTKKSAPCHDIRDITSWWHTLIGRFDSLTYSPPPPPDIHVMGMDFDPDTMYFDYDHYANSSQYAQMGNSNTLYMKAGIAYALNDHEGLDAAIMEAKSNSQSESDIKRQLDGARKRSFEIPRNYIKRKQNK